MHTIAQSNSIFSICGISPNAAYIIMHDGVAAIDRYNLFTPDDGGCLI